MADAGKVTAVDDEALRLILAQWPLARVMVAGFETWLDRFDAIGPFQKPAQLLCHLRTLGRRRELGSGASAMRDAEFQEALYETLRAWGLGERASRLKPLGDFRDQLYRHAEAIAVIESTDSAIDDATLNLGATADRLWRVIETLALVDNRATLVSGTKALHHVLPDLVVPMDREYTQRFFGWRNPRFQYEQRRCFAEAFTAFACISRLVRPSEHVGAGWRSCSTKVIDNAVVAVVQAIPDLAAADARNSR